jgi:hypothetical protein
MYEQVSVLENWKEREVCKLQGVASQSEAYLKSLKLMSRYPRPPRVIPIKARETWMEKVIYTVPPQGLPEPCPIPTHTILFAPTPSTHKNENKQMGKNLVWQKIAKQSQKCPKVKP